MGIPELWQSLSWFKREIATTELGGKILGVDVSYMLHAVGGNDNQTRLQGLKKWIDRFVSVFHFTPFFVFDGTGPTDKISSATRDKLREEIRGILPGLVAHIRELGLPYIFAPVEADHQLVWLNRARYIYAILTDDGDLLLHDGVKVIRFRSLRDNASTCNEFDLGTFFANLEGEDVPTDVSSIGKLLYERHFDRGATTWRQPIHGMDPILAAYGVLQCDYLSFPGVGSKTILRIVELARAKAFTVKNFVLACLQSSMNEEDRTWAKHFKYDEAELGKVILTALVRLGKSFVVTLPEGDYLPLVAGPPGAIR
jgi:hypothetical protein